MSNMDSRVEKYVVSNGIDFKIATEIVASEIQREYDERERIAEREERRILQHLEYIP